MTEGPIDVHAASKRKLYSGEVAPQERIKLMTTIITRNAKVPSRILEADYVEYQRGLRFLGPSDFYFYARIKVAKGDSSKWLKKPYNNSTAYSMPPIKEKWWITEKEFKKLKLYEPKKYFGPFNGWLAFDATTGYPYIHTYTM